MPLYNHDVTIVGMALQSNGLTGNNTIDGYSVNTFGFLFGCSSIWEIYQEDITTAWVGCTTGLAYNIEFCND